MPLVFSDATERTRHIFKQPPPAPACRSTTRLKPRWLDSVLSECKKIFLKKTSIKVKIVHPSPSLVPCIYKLGQTTINTNKIKRPLCWSPCRMAAGTLRRTSGWRDEPSLTGDATFFITPLSAAVKAECDKKCAKRRHEPLLEIPIGQ